MTQTDSKHNLGAPDKTLGTLQPVRVGRAQSSSVFSVSRVSSINNLLVFNLGDRFDSPRRHQRLRTHHSTL
jgi:hypothetical protein